MMSSHKIATKNEIRRMALKQFHNDWQFAPKPLTESALAALASGSRKRRRLLEDLIPVVEAAVDASIMSLFEALNNVSPEMYLTLLDSPDSSDHFRTNESLPISRAQLLWLIATCGRGSSTDINTFSRLFDAYLAWHSVNSMNESLRMMRRDSEVTIASEVSRQVSVGYETQMSWTCAEISIATGQWIDKNIPSATRSWGESLQRQTAEVCRRFYDYHDMHGRIDEVLGSLTRGITSATLDRYCFSNSPQTAADLSLILHSDACIRFPVAKIQGRHWVANWEAWTLFRYYTVLEAAMELAAAQKPPIASGTVLEEVTATLLRKWGPVDIKWTTSVDLIERLDTKTVRHDIDIMGETSDRAIIMEVKANRIPKNRTSVDSNFHDTILEKAQGQLDTRMQAWANGARPASLNATSDSDPIGVAVTLTGYAGAQWNPSGFTHIGSSNAVRYPSSPLPSLVLAMSTLETGEEVANYLEFRQEALARGASSPEELELICAFKIWPQVSNQYPGLKSDPFMIAPIRIQKWQSATQFPATPEPSGLWRKIWIRSFFSSLSNVLPAR